MPETITPEPEETPETDSDAETDVEETEEEPEFYIPTPGGLRGL